MLFEQLSANVFIHSFIRLFQTASSIVKKNRNRQTEQTDKQTDRTETNLLIFLAIITDNLKWYCDVSAVWVRVARDRSGACEVLGAELICVV